MRRALPIITVLATLLVVACQFDERTVAVQAPQVVVHAVLDPGADFQQVLVERTLTGAANVSDDQRFDPTDPINSGGGIPIGDCDITVTGPDGVFVGEEVLAPGKPFNYHTGRYLIHLPTQSVGSPVPLRSGARYALRVVTPDGHVVTGTTVVPYAFAFSPGTRLDPFNRDRDSLRLSWNAFPGARSYLLRAESPFGPFLLFTDSTHITLHGDLRNYFADGLQRVFIPGFRQRVSVAAVDSNYFDYYRTRNDPFTGAGIINRLEGGIGLFGSAVSVAGRNVDVSQDSREPAIEGVWDAADPDNMMVVVRTLRLYVETPGEPAALSGWFVPLAGYDTPQGMVGTRINGRIVLKLLNTQSASDTMAVFSGVQRGDSLIGDFGGAARVVLLKRPSQSR